jgi:hypothetical protein
MRNDLNVPKVLDPFAVYAILEHGDNFIPAWKAAARMVKDKGWEDATAPRVGDSTLGYEILSAQQAVGRLKARDMIVEDLLERESLVIASGQSNSGKTTVLEYLALCVAMGHSFGVHQCERSRVLWIAGEDQYNAQLRIAAMCTEYGVKLSDLSQMLYVLPQAIAVLSKVSMESFHEAVTRCVGAGTTFALVVIDSKSMCWGGDDENSNDENAQFVKGLSEHFVAEYGAAVIVTHHLTKNKEKEEQTARGASALINNCDHEWRFEMRGASGVSVLEPGSKLRIARWPEMRFAIKVVALDQQDYPKLCNSQGAMPKISIAEVTTTHGAMAKQAVDDAEYVTILRALIAKPLNAQSKKRVNEVLSRAIGKVQSGMSTADIRSGREWIRYRLRKMIEQKLVNDNLEVTDGGHALVEQQLLQERIEEERRETDDASIAVAPEHGSD